jgi:hypothetical protein
MPYEPSGPPALTLYERIFGGGNRLHDIILPQEGEADPALVGAPTVGSQLGKAAATVAPQASVANPNAQQQWNIANKAAIDPSLRGLYNAAAAQGK